MPSPPRVSIVLATHNQGSWLAETIGSVRTQTWTDWELIVVDDGSTDDTPAILRAAAADTRIQWSTQTRGERCVARNRAIARARGEWVAFLDGDDLWHPEKLAQQLAAPEAAWNYTLARFVDEHGTALPQRKPPTPIGGQVFARLVRANFMILASVIVRRAVLTTVGGFDEHLPVLGCEDWDLWLRIARHHPVTACAAELTGYRRHPGNTAGSQLLASGLAVLDRQFDDPTTAATAGISRAAARARLLWYHAGAAAESARTRARPLVWAALRTAPSQLFSRPAFGALGRFVWPSLLAGHRPGGGAAPPAGPWLPSNAGAAPHATAPATRGTPVDKRAP